MLCVAHVDNIVHQKHCFACSASLEILVYDYVTVCIKSDVVTYYRNASVKHSRTFAVHCKIAVYTHVQVWCLGRELQIPC